MRNICTGPSGWLALLGDMGAYFAQGYGLLAMALAAAGPGPASAPRARRRAAGAGLLPLLAILSFTLCFNFAALRSDDRFLLPQARAGLRLYRHRRRGPGLRGPALAAAGGAARLLAVTALLALHRCIAVNAALLLDPAL